MSLWANAHDLAHEREIEELRREIGTIRHDLEVARGERDIAFDDIDDLSRKLSATQVERDAARALIVEWWFDPDNPPAGAAAIAHEARDKGPGR